MSEESTTPDLVAMTRVFFETMDRDCDFDSLAGFFASDAVWDLSDSHLGIYEGVAAIGDFLVGYWATWEDHHHEIEAIHDFGHGVLSVAVREDGCLRGSDARVQAAASAGVRVGARRDPPDNGLPERRRGPCCRRTPRQGTGVGDARGVHDPRSGRALATDD